MNAAPSERNDYSGIKGESAVGVRGRLKRCLVGERSPRSAASAHQRSQSHLNPLQLVQMTGSCQQHGYGSPPHRRGQSETRTRHGGGDPVPTGEPLPHGDRHKRRHQHLQRIQRVPASRETKAPIIVLCEPFQKCNASQQSIGEPNRLRRND